VIFQLRVRGDTELATTDSVVSSGTQIAAGCAASYPAPPRSGGMGGVQSCKAIFSNALRLKNTPPLGFFLAGTLAGRVRTRGSLFLQVGICVRTQRGRAATNRIKRRFRCSTLLNPAVVVCAERRTFGAGAFSAPDEKAQSHIAPATAIPSCHTDTSLPLT